MDSPTFEPPASLSFLPPERLAAMASLAQGPWGGAATLLEGHAVRWGEPVAGRYVLAVAVHAALALLLVPASLLPLLALSWRRLHRLAGILFLLVYPLVWLMGTACCLARLTYDGWAPARADGFTTPVMLTFIWLGYVGVLGVAEGYLVRVGLCWGWPLRRLARGLLVLNVLQIAQGVAVFIFGLLVTARPEGFPADWAVPFTLVMIGYPLLCTAFGCLNLRFWGRCLAGAAAPPALLGPHHVRNALTAAGVVWAVAAGHGLTALGWSGTAGSTMLRSAHFFLNWVLPLQIAGVVGTCLTPQSHPGGGVAAKPLGVLASPARSVLAASLLGNAAAASSPIH